jgi:linoleate 10R-lipoxygenase
VVAAVIPTAAHFSQAIAHVIDFYLNDEKKAEREEIVRLSKTLDGDRTSGQKIMQFVHEALHANPLVRGVYRTSASETVLGFDKVPAGARVFASIIDANRDVSCSCLISFTDRLKVQQAASVKTAGDKNSVLGLGEHGLLSRGFFESVKHLRLATLALFSRRKF